MAIVTDQSFLRHRHGESRREPPPRTRRGQRTEVCPPRPPRPRWWIGLWRWLMATSIHEAVSGFWSAGRAAAPHDDLLDAARQQFFDAIDDFDGARAIALAEAIDRARTRQELWHLRADVFALVSSRLDQAAAEERLSRLNRFFPTRSPKSGFVSLEESR